MKGYYHSVESFGTVDGPGIRLVVFMQGCPMRCLYCHNPDTWKISKEKEITKEEILTLYQKNITFYNKNGGITFTGGEPMLQLDFLIECTKYLKEKGIHITVDTSGITYREDDVRYNELIKYVDLFLLDIKELDNEKHKVLCGKENTNILKFLNFLEINKKDVWIRHVIVPTYTYDLDSLYNLGKFLKDYKVVKKIEPLPYHTMGVTKYDNLNIDYPLKGIKELSNEELKIAKDMIIKGLKEKSPKANK